MITKFRGKSKDKSTMGFDAGIWLYGSLINNVFFFKDGTPACSIIDTSYLAYDCWNDWGEWMDDYDVDPKTVGQFTGKQDVNGVDIYADDILLVKNHYLKVFWNFHLAQWDTQFLRLHESVVDKFRVEWIPGGLKNCDWEYYAEVVGNIHENPELVQE